MRLPAFPPVKGFRSRHRFARRSRQDRDPAPLQMPQQMVQGIAADRRRFIDRALIHVR